MSKHDPMRIDKLLSAASRETKREKNTNCVSKSKNVREVKKQSKRGVLKADLPEKYDVLSTLTEAQSELTFGQL